MRCSTFVIPLCSAIFGVFAGFGLGATYPAQAQSTAPAAEIGISAETVVAVVDEKPITLGELIVARQKLPEAFQSLPDEVLMDSLIKQIVDQQILANAAEASGLHRSKRATFALKNTNRQVLSDMYVSETVRTGVTEQRIEAIYAEKFVAADPVLQLRAAHILVDDQSQAEDVLKRLNEGVDFSTLAAEFGTDLTSARGGDLGWQDIADLLPAFAAAVEEMEPGQISGPVKSPFGWHVIRLDQRRVKPVPSLYELRESLRKDLEAEIRDAAVATATEAASIKVMTDAVPAGAIRDDALILP